MDWKDFFIGPPQKQKVADTYHLELPEFNRNPLIGIGAQGYSFEFFQTLPLLDMIAGPIGERGVVKNFWKPLQPMLVALRPAGPPLDIAQIPIGEIELFSEPSYSPEE